MMAATHSPHRDSAGCFEFKSSHSPARFDPQSAIREIRRSLSRSPSKPQEFRQFAFKAHTPSTNTMPITPSPLSPSRRSMSDNFLQPQSMTSPFTSRIAAGSRLHRPIMKRTAQTVGALRTRTSPRSPSRRALVDSRDSGNATPVPLRKRSSTEADREPVSEHDADDEETDKENVSGSQEDQMTWKSSRQEKRRSGGFHLLTEVAPLSPMKRTKEGSFSHSQYGTASPSAKRRSLHAPSLDFSIFDSDSIQSGGHCEPRAQDDNDWFRYGSALAATRFSTIPRRSSSLRKSTLQQRSGDRSSVLRVGLMAEMDGASLFETTAGPENKIGLRMSLDSHLAPMERESPFSRGSLLSASIHPLCSAQTSQRVIDAYISPQGASQSSSLISPQDDSPTHEPIHRTNRPKSHDFSKSLPVGALRPAGQHEGPSEEQTSSQGSFATPANYKFAKPLPAAFMSTGLISKKNRNVDDPIAGLTKAHMPDTPCKKQPPIFTAETKGMPLASVVAKKHIFGTPSIAHDSPMQSPRGAPLAFAKHVALFGARAKTTMMRKASFASIDGGDKTIGQSPKGLEDSQTESTDAEYPPTPTKHAQPESRSNASISPSPHRTLQVSNPPGSTQGPRFSSSKLSPIGASPESNDRDSDSVMEDSPSTCLRPKSTLKVTSIPLSSFIQVRIPGDLNSPTPLSRRNVDTLDLRSPALERTKMVCSVSVSPRHDRFDRTSPHTPLEGFFPDPSGLTISGKLERPTTRHGSLQPAVPATPTGPREYFPNFSNRPSLNLASSDVVDVDRSLSSRFGKVDLIGTGEFSQVYRVCQAPETSPFQKLYPFTLSRSSSRASLPGRVWAVKKSRYPYTGAKDRQRKIHEVDVLKTLGHNDHILGFVGSWEENNHLYIQTEFCEEGTLDVFLAQTGLKARVDDFRIWKILLELSLGVKHIHDNDFIHLDLKPANILISFEGVLKIADFGMATKWPAKAGIDGEGDREYIGPEILMGQYDKPADIFALGLIMLETAGNVELPDNGLSWQKLRSGDMSDVPSLTCSSETSNINRDASGVPVNENEKDGNMEHDVVDIIHTDEEHEARNQDLGHLVRSGELVQPPPFMVDPHHEQSLQQIVRWMISPNPSDRPQAGDFAQVEGVAWAGARRRAGATVFEGNWGPADEVLAEDAEMIDV